MKLITLILLSTLIITQAYSQEHLEVEGSARIKQKLAVESLSGNGIRNVVTDANGELLIETKKTGAVSIPAASFSGKHSTAKYAKGTDFNPFSSIPIGVDPSTTTDDLFIAPVLLPDGVTMDSIRIIYRDNSLENDFIITFRAFDAQSSHAYQLTNYVTSGTPSAPQNDRVSALVGLSQMPVVNNSKFSYHFELYAVNQWEPSNLNISNIHIYYTE